MKTKYLIALLYFGLGMAGHLHAEATDANGGEYRNLKGSSSKVSGELHTVCEMPFNPDGSRRQCGMIGTYKTVEKACNTTCVTGIVPGTLTLKIPGVNMYEVTNTPIVGSTVPKYDDHCGVYGANGSNLQPSLALPRCALCKQMRDGRYRTPGMVGTFTSALVAFESECQEDGGVDQETITQFEMGKRNPCQPIYPDTCPRDNACMQN